jgi:hypothetical protein
MSPYRYSPWFERFTRRQLVAAELLSLSRNRWAYWFLAIDMATRLLVAKQQFLPLYAHSKSQDPCTHVCSSPAVDNKHVGTTSPRKIMSGDLVTIRCGTIIDLADK